MRVIRGIVAVRMPWQGLSRNGAVRAMTLAVGRIGKK